MSRFGGKLVLVLLDNRDQPSVRGGRSLWALQRDLTYQTGADPAEVITVPAGFVTDLTSVPRLFWSFTPPDGPWVKGAVVHDFLYYTQGDGVWNTRVGIPQGRAPYSRRDADHILREAMADRGSPAWRQFAIWLSVRLGGAKPWAARRRKPRPEPTAAELAAPGRGADAQAVVR